MGMFSDLRTTSKMAREIGNNWDPQAQRDASKIKMANLNEMLKAQTAAMNSVAVDGMPANAQVISVGNSTAQVNMQPVVPVELLIMSPGAAPRPLSTTLVVPVMSVPRLQPGATLPCTVSASNPDAVLINW